MYIGGNLNNRKYATTWQMSTKPDGLSLGGLAEVDLIESTLLGTPGCRFYDPRLAVF